MANRDQRRRAGRRQDGSAHTVACVVCGGRIPRNHVGMYVTDKWTGTIYGAHMHCGDGPEGAKKMKAGLKVAMTTPEWWRFRGRQFRIGWKRSVARFAARWTTSPKMTGDR